MLTWLLKSLITAYQRWLSPYKGFSCAHRILHGGASCSGYALQIFESDGPWRLLSLMHQRFHDCAQANASLRASRTAAISDSTAAESTPEPPEESASDVGWYGDQGAADRYARSYSDDDGERAVRCCAELTFASPRGCLWP